MDMNGRCFFMDKYRMKQLQNLDQQELEVKQHVLQHIRQQSSKERKNRMPHLVTMSTFFIAAVILFILIKSIEHMAPTNNAMFSLNEINIDELESRTSYYMATAIKWSGEHEASLKTIELVDGSGAVVDYENNHIAMRVWNVNDAIEPGLYKKEDIQSFDEFSTLQFQQNAEHIVMLEIILNDQFSQSNDLQLKLIFQVDNEEHIQILDWETLHHLKVESVNVQELRRALQITVQEIEAYELLKENRDRTVLQELSPISIARLYWLAQIEGEDELQYNLYIQQSDRVMWSF